MTRRICRGGKAPVVQRCRGRTGIAAGNALPGEEVGQRVFRLGLVTPNKGGDPREEEGVAAGPIGPGRRWSLSYAGPKPWLREESAATPGRRKRAAAFATNPSGRR